MSERRLSLTIVIVVVALMVVGIVALIVWRHEGSQLPPGQASIVPGLVGPIPDRGQQVAEVRRSLNAAKHPVLDKSECVKPPKDFQVEGMRCIIRGVPLDPKPLILIAPTPKSAR